MILKRTAALVVVLASMASSISAGGVSHRSKTSTVKGRSSGRRLQGAGPAEAKEERCKWLVKAPKGKGGKKAENTRARRRRAAVPNETFVQQEVQTVSYDQGIMPPKPAPEPPLLAKGGKGAPPGFIWSYGDGGEKPDPAYDYVECETPSSQPSSSSRPSTFPSRSPSVSPSDFPSLNPSPSPSISQLPSLSLNPSISSVPSQGPTMAYSPACEALKNDPTYVHDTEETVTYSPVDPRGYYEYQVVFNNEVSRGELIEDVEEVLQSTLSESLIWCPTSDDKRQMRALSSRALMSAHNPDMVIDGIDLHGTKKNGEKQCAKTVTVGEGQTCEVLTGKFTTYVRKMDQTPTQENVAQHVITKIEEAMKDNALARKVTSAITIVYEGAEKNGKGDETVNIAAGERGQDKKAENGITGVGGLMLALGACVTLLFLFAATRKREHHKLKVVEQVFEDDESIFGKSTTDIMSNGSGNWKTQRGAHVLGEDDSVSSEFDGHDILADMKMAEKRHLYGAGSRGIRGPQEDNLGARGDALDVHNCTSATCQICTGRNRPIFVNSDLLSPIEEVPSSREVSPITPSYANTIDMDIAERQYMSPDTVDM